MTGTLSEKVFQRQVLDLAKLAGWLVVHFRPARTAHGWRTPCAGDAKGFVDLILVRECLLFVELKTDNGTLTPAQQVWLDRLRVAGAETYVWRPADWPKIQTRLLS